METGQTRNLLDQIFDAIDGNNFCKARYEMSQALEAEKHAPSKGRKTSPNSSPGVEGQA